ncbi:MAG: diguanylate cyclase [Pseudomonadaceae bacterium]|nr:diguanylate cyclase [Pseudomonadaceae bacterium]
MSGCSAGWSLSAPVVFTLLVWLGVLWLSRWILQQRYFPGRNSFFVMHLGMLWWLLSAALELAVQGAECKMFWAAMAWPGIMSVPTCWAVFLWQYVNSDSQSLPARQVFSLTLAPGVCWLLALSNPWHGWFYGAGSGPVSAQLGAPIRYEHGPLFFAAAVYVYLLMLFCFAVVLRAAKQNQGLYRQHYLAFVLLTLLPWSANLSYVGVGVTLFGFDPTPFSFALTLLAFGWLIVGVRLFDVLPVARHLLLEALLDPVLVLDPQQRVIEANPAALQLAGSGANWQGRELRLWPVFGRALAEMLQQPGSAEGAQLLTLDTPARYLEVRRRNIERRLHSGNRILGEMLYLRDVTESHQSELKLVAALSVSEERLQTISALHEQLREQALRDPLTGLYNRRYLAEFFLRERAHAQRDNHNLALAMLDLDHFKALNDSFGHLVGDDVLKALAAQLSGHLRSSDALFRIGGEEFVLIMPGADAAVALSRLQSICRELASTPLHTRDGPQTITVSIGLALWPAQGQSLEQLLSAADSAMYAAKNAGRNRVELSAVGG